MPQFFINSSQIRGDRFIINGGDFHHLAGVRRVKPGTELNLRTEDGFSLTGVVEIIGKTELSGRILKREGSCILPVNLHLCAGLLKGRKFDFVIQKAVELGVCSIIPVVTERTVPDLTGKEAGRTDRWRRIAFEAAKQSGRPGVPEVRDISPFKETISGFNHTRILAHPDRGAGSLKDFIGKNEKSMDVALLVGPEGGFSASEIETAAGYGWDIVNFGFTCLRAETAALVLPAVIIYEWSSSGENKGK